MSNPQAEASVIIFAPILIILIFFIFVILCMIPSYLFHILFPDWWMSAKGNNSSMLYIFLFWLLPIYLIIRRGRESI